MLAASVKLASMKALPTLRKKETLALATSLIHRSNNMDELQKTFFLLHQNLSMLMPLVCICLTIS